MREPSTDGAEVEQELWEPGRVVLGLYEVGEELGGGGMGVVHKVRHRNWNHWMAVKSPRPQAVRGKKGKEQFVSEAELWVNLPAHPNVVTCHYVRTIGGTPRLFAEYVDGGSLRERIAGGRLRRLEDMLDVAIQMAWGLAVAHGEGLVHEDMKPGNVMLTSGGTAKITDFGLARARARAAGGEVAGDAAVDVGVSARGKTTEYASPEQMAGERLTGKTDIWSWAVTVLDMFAGGVSCELGPVAGWTLEEYLKRGPQESLPAMPQGLVRLLRRCFASEPEGRPGNFEEIAEELRKVYREAMGEVHGRQVPEKADFLADGLNNRALSMLDLGRADESKRLWEEALKTDPSHPDSMYNLGLLRWRNAEVDDMAVVQQLKEVCRVNEGDWLPQYLLALVHLERDDTEKAIATLEAIAGEDTRREEVKWALERARERSPGRHLMRTFEEHHCWVNSVSLSADGRCALSGNADEIVKLWDVATGKCLRTFEGYKEDDAVFSVCLSVNAQYALSGSSDRTLKLWDVATGECLRTFEGHTGYVNSVCLSADGQHALSGSGDKNLTLWDVATGRCLRSFEGHESSVKSVCLSVNAQYALSGSSDRTLKLWDVATGECLRTFEGHTGYVNSVCLSVNAQYALSGSSDRTLKLWDVATGECLRTFEGHTGDVNSACLTADGEYALSGGLGLDDPLNLKLWDVSTGRCLRTFAADKPSVASVSLSGDSRYALSGSWNHSLKLWQISRHSGEFVAPPQASIAQAGEAASKDQQTLRKWLGWADDARRRGDYRESARLVRQARSLSGYELNTEVLAMWSALYSCLPKTESRGAWVVRTFEGHAGTVLSVSLSADGCYALSGSSDRTLKLWNVTTGECLRTFEGHADSVRSVCLSADAQFALSGSIDATLKLWDVATGACLHTFEGHRSGVLSVCLSGDAQFALSGSFDATLKLWDIATGRCRRTFRYPCTVASVCLSADTQFALSGGADGNLKLWNVATGECLRTFEGHADEVSSACLSADGQYALSGSWDKTLRLWDVATGRFLRSFEGHADKVWSACLSADGQYALSGSWDKTLRLWDVATGECLLTSEGPSKGVVSSVCLGAHGQCALSGTDKTLKLWCVDWDLEDREPVDWDEGARPYLENFLTLHTPYLAELPQEREPTEEEVTRALTRGGRPQWTEDDFRGLLYTLGCAGYGWLRPEGVRGKLEGLAKERS